MATITIRNLDDSIKQQLRIQAASHNHSMEEEVRLILQKTIQNNEVEGKIGTRIHSRFKEAGGIEMPEPKRSQNPCKADFE